MQKHVQRPRGCRSLPVEEVIAAGQGSNGGVIKGDVLRATSTATTLLPDHVCTSAYYRQAGGPQAFSLLHGTMHNMTSSPACVQARVGGLGHGEGRALDKAWKGSGGMGRVRWVRRLALPELLLRVVCVVAASALRVRSPTCICPAGRKESSNAAWVHALVSACS